MKAVFLDYATMGPALDLGPLTELVPELELHDTTPEELIGDRVRDAGFVFLNKVRLGANVLESATNLRFVGLTATGTDNVDLDSAKRHGIAVCNIRGYCTSSVTEHVFGTILTLAHNLHRYRSAVRAGAWQKAQSFCMHDFPVRELSSMTIGIVGFGTLGHAVADMARHFDMDVIVAARPGTTKVPAGRVELDELLERADVISLHCPLTDDTRNLFGKNEFARMKPSAFLINTARGALVDSAALVDALRQGEIGGAAIDVLSQEPPVGGSPLLDYDGDNLIVTPHIAWTTDRARQEAIAQLAANVRSFLEGGDRNRVV